MRSLLAVIGMSLVVASAHAAGGHFDVDDATVLDPGRCQYEVWVVRTPASGATFARLGPGCRVGPVEVGVNLDRSSGADNGRTLLGPQLKWAVDLLPDKLGAGLAWSASYDLTNHGRPAQTLYAPFSWRAAEKLWVHANIGIDRDLAGTRWRRQGLSGEWAANENLTFIAERVKIAGDWTSRLGGRFNISETLSVDLSAARFGPLGERVYGIGVNQEFAR
jgi:hypothetical protein